MILNLKTAITCRGLRSYQVAQAAGIAEFLNMNEAWLFRAICSTWAEGNSCADAGCRTR
jgi:hypothetical protein